MYLKHVKQKNKDGTYRVYLQFVESIRTEDGPRQKIIANFGRIDDKDGKQKIEILAVKLIEVAETLDLFNPDKDLKAEWSKPFGVDYIFRNLFKKIGLEKIFDKVFEGCISPSYDIKETLFNLILNRLDEPCSKRGVTDWQEDQFAVKEHELQHYYRSMDYLDEYSDVLEDEVYSLGKSLSSCKQKDLNVALFDTTSIVYYGKGIENEEEEESESILDYGFSKARRSDLKQIVVGLALTYDGIPISHQCYQGNTNDTKCFNQLIGKFHKKHGAKNITFIGDRGMISNKNVELLESNNYGYILGFRMRTIRKVERSEVLKKANIKKIKDSLEYKEVRYRDRRLIICYNEERAKIDKKKRQDIIERINKKIKNGSITSIIDNSDYKRFLKIEGKNPIIDNEKVAQDEVFDGIFILTTNTHKTAGQIVAAYKSLWQCEFGFRTLKSEIEMGPMYHRVNRRIKAHIFICFLALFLRVILIKKIKKEEPEASYRQVIRGLKKLHAVKIKIRKSEIITRTEIDESAKIAFNATKTAFPRKILHHENNDHIVVKI